MRHTKYNQNNNGTFKKKKSLSEYDTLGKLAGYVLLGILGFFTVIGLSGKVYTAFAETPEQKFTKMQEDACNTVRVREEKCHSGNQAECQELKKSANWMAGAPLYMSIADCFAITADFLVGGSE